MSNGNATSLVTVLDLARVDLVELRRSKQLSHRVYSTGERAAVIEALKQFGNLSSNYAVNDRATLDGLMRLWKLPSAPVPNWPHLHTGPLPVELPLATLDRVGDCVMLVTADKIEFYTRTEVPLEASAS